MAGDPVALVRELSAEAARLAEELPHQAALSRQMYGELRRFAAAAAVAPSPGVIADGCASRHPSTHALVPSQPPAVRVPASAAAAAAVDVAAHATTADGGREAKGRQKGEEAGRITERELRDGVEDGLVVRGQPVVEAQVNEPDAFDSSGYGRERYADGAGDEQRVAGGGPGHEGDAQQGRVVAPGNGV